MWRKTAEHQQEAVYSFRVAWTFDVAFTTFKLKAVAYRVLTGQFVDKPTLGQSSRGIGQLAGSEI